MVPEGGHRVGSCAKFAVRGAASPMVRHDGGDGPAFMTGLAHCNSIHGCPSCSAKIRYGRAREIEAGIRAHLDAGGLALLVTLTAPHHLGQPLDDLWGGTSGSWRAMMSGRRRERLRGLGLVGFIRTVDVTRGPNGWHPHLHVLLLFERELTIDELATLGAELVAGWSAGLARAGIARPRLAYAFNLGTVRDEAALGTYLAKVNGMANELTRADRKVGRAGNRTPFEILADVADHGLAEDWELYCEWLEASKGRRVIEWSRGLRARLLGTDHGPSDEELVAEQSPAVDVCRVSRELWAAVRRHDLLTPRACLHGRFLAAAGRGGVLGGLGCLAHAGMIAVARGPTDGSGVPVLVLLADRSPTAKGTPR